jgi:hypothetical protein
MAGRQGWVAPAALMAKVVMEATADRSMDPEPADLSASRGSKATTDQPVIPVFLERMENRASKVTTDRKVTTGLPDRKDLTVTPVCQVATPSGVLLAGLASEDQTLPRNWELC